MNDKELSALESLARAATPGPWHIKRGYCLYDERDMHVVSAWENYSGSKEMTIDCEEAYANARFLELTNPATVLELLAELRACHELIEVITKAATMTESMSLTRSHFDHAAYAEVCRNIPELRKKAGLPLIGDGND